MEVHSIGVAVALASALILFCRLIRFEQIEVKKFKFFIPRINEHLNEFQNEHRKFRWKDLALIMVFAIGAVAFFHS